MSNVVVNKEHVGEAIHEDVGVKVGGFYGYQDGVKSTQRMF